MNTMCTPHLAPNVFHNHPALPYYISYADNPQVFVGNPQVSGHEDDACDDGGGIFSYLCGCMNGVCKKCTGVESEQPLAPVEHSFQHPYQSGEAYAMHPMQQMCSKPPEHWMQNESMQPMQTPWAAVPMHAMPPFSPWP